MTAFVLALIVAGGAQQGADPCHAILDRTPGCAAPAQAATSIVADAKPAPEKPALFDPEKLPGELGFLGTGLALGGGVAIAASFAFTPRTDLDHTVHTVEQVGGVSLLIWSGLVGVSAVAVQAFDPSSGTFRWKSVYTGADG